MHVAGDVPGRLDAQLQPFGGLRGRVVDEEGKPAGQVRVEITQISQVAPGRVSDTGAVSDENGEFVFKDLPSGSYIVVAKPQAVTRIEDGVKLGTVPIYYPSATELADALPVAVGRGADVAGIAIRLKSVPAHRVAGVVLDADGKPKAHATVRVLGRAGAAQPSYGGGTINAGPGREGIIRAGGPGGGMGGVLALFSNMSTTITPGAEPEVAEVESRDDGTFEFPAVERGDWRVTVQSSATQPSATEDSPRFGVASVAVADKDIDDVRIRLAGPFAIAATTTWGNPPARGNAQDAGELPWSRVGLAALEGQPRLNLDPATGRTFEDYSEGRVSGFFPGRYRVTATAAPPGYYIAAVMWGGRDVLGQVVEFGESSGPVQVMLRNDMGTLRGTAAGTSENDSSVYLIRQMGEIVSYRVVDCGAGGAFQFDGVAPGDYYVVAFDHAGRRALPPVDLLQSVIPLASSVRVESGATASVELRTSRWPF